MTEDLLIRLSGRFDLTSPLVLASEDSGRNGHRVIWESAPGQVATLSGGESIFGWEKEGTLWVAPVAGKSFRQLYINDERAIRARSPNLEDPSNMGPYHRLVRWDLGGTDENGNNPVLDIAVRSDDVPSGAVSGVSEIFVQRHWDLAIMRVDHIDNHGAESRVYFRAADAAQQIRAYPQRENDQAYHWENALEFLDSPGEWFHDRVSGKLYYMPRPGEEIESLVAYAPALENVVRIEGAGAVVLREVAIENSTWLVPDDKGHGEIQGALFNLEGDYLPGAVDVRDSSDVTIERCLIHHTGAQGIRVSGDTTRISLVGNRITDTAANAIAFTSSWNQTSGGSVDDVVANNTIDRVGRNYSGAIGINAMYPAHLIVEHNQISDVPYSGISIGFNWHEEDVTTNRDNQVRFNDIFNVCTLLDDGGGVYTLGRQLGTNLYENWIHDIGSAPWAGIFPRVAFYLDQGSFGISVHHNSVTGIGYGIHENHDPATPLDIYENGYTFDSLAEVRSAAGPLPEYEWTGLPR
jgi:hypothetical protein